MTLSFSRLGLFHIVRLLTTTVLAGWVSSPMSWSPDGEWLCYTTIADAEPEDFRPGAVVLPSAGLSEPANAHGQAARGPTGPSPIYRVWATGRDRKESVLIEESQSPLSAPVWSPRGKSVAFGRFVPHSLEPAQTVQRGRYEVVIQDGLDRKRVAWSSAEIGLDPMERTHLPQLACAWSPDGLYLAVQRPGAQTAVEIVRTDTGKRVLILDRAALPAWSPDGSKCAYIRQEKNSIRLDYIERRGQSFGDPRLVGTVGPIPTTPYWNSDSRSIWAVVEKPMARSRELEIVRFVLEPSDSLRVMNLMLDPIKRGAAVRGLTIDFDREGERCFFALDLAGRDADVVWCLPRERGAIHKRFHPLDVSQRIAGVSIAPDGQLVAMRFGTERGLSAPVIYDCETDQTTLLVPDDDARREWLLDLAGAARQILATSLPPAVVDGQKVERPTLLPLPGEIQDHAAAVPRLNRLARFGSMLCSLPADRHDSAKRQEVRIFQTEMRLFFDYLRGDYVAATADLDDFEPLLSSPQMRLAILSLRAQILWGRGDRSGARSVIDYLISRGDPNRRLVEETPFGLVFSPAISPDQVWANYLSSRAAQGIEPKLTPDSEFPNDVFDPRLQEPGLAPMAPLIERGGRPIPFAPFAPAREFP